LFEEIEKHKKEILQKSGLSDSEFDLFFSIVSSRINLLPKNEFKDFVKKAIKITPDKNDTEYFALALKLNCAVWTNDKKLKEQKEVKVYSTEEVIILLKDF